MAHHLEKSRQTYVATAFSLDLPVIVAGGNRRVGETVQQVDAILHPGNGNTRPCITELCFYLFIYLVVKYLHGSRRTILRSPPSKSADRYQQ